MKHSQLTAAQWCILCICPSSSFSINSSDVPLGSGVSDANEAAVEENEYDLEKCRGYFIHQLQNCIIGGAGYNNVSKG